jgi:surface antigen
MRAKLSWGLVWGAVAMTFLAVPTRRAAAGNCALYARAQTGVDLFGAAGGWWNQAAGRYQRGHVPEVGSILVFRRTGYIPYGHVAVVAQIISAREIVVNQANWYRGMVTRDVPVIDESPDNDWTSVSVLDLGSGKYGRDNPSFGFVYPETGPREIVASADTGGFDPGIAAGRTAYEPDQGATLFHFAVAADDRRRNTAHRRAARGWQRKKAAAHVAHRIPIAHTRGRAAGHAHFSARVDPAAVHAAAAHNHAGAATVRRAEAAPNHRG